MVGYAKGSATWLLEVLDEELNCIDGISYSKKFLKRVTMKRIKIPKHADGMCGGHGMEALKVKRLKKIRVDTRGPSTQSHGEAGFSFSDFRVAYLEIWECGL